MNTQVGSLEHLGTIYCPASLIGIITLDKEGLLSLWQRVCGLPEGKHEVQFPYMHGDSDLEIAGQVWIDESGVWAHDLKAIDEVCNEYQVVFDLKYFNTYYLR